MYSSYGPSNSLFSSFPFCILRSVPLLVLDFVKYILENVPVRLTGALGGDRRISTERKSDHRYGVRDETSIR